MNRQWLQKQFNKIPSMFIFSSSFCYTYISTTPQHWIDPNTVTSSLLHPHWWKWTTGPCKQETLTSAFIMLGPLSKEFFISYVFSSSMVFQAYASLLKTILSSIPHSQKKISLLHPWEKSRPSGNKFEFHYPGPISKQTSICICAYASKVAKTVSLIHLRPNDLL